MLEKLVKAFKESNNIVFFTGAGMSTDSGIPDFRSETGLYTNNLHAEEIISHSYFLKDTKGFYDFYKNKMIFENAIPNYGHMFIKKMEELGKNVSVVTQNIDGLHQLAGSRKVYEVHGSIHINYCMNCHKFYGLDVITKSKGIPYCECGGIIKPDVVLYEENLDEETISKAIGTIKDSDTLIILGTSLNVYPAASFVRYFKGKNLVIINKTSTPADNMCDIVIHDNISNTFKKIEKELF